MRDLYEQLEEDLLGGEYVRSIFLRPRSTETELHIEVVGEPCWIGARLYSGPWLYLERLRQQGRAEPLTQQLLPDTHWADRDATGTKVLIARLTKARPPAILWLWLGSGKDWTDPSRRRV